MKRAQADVRTVRVIPRRPTPAQLRRREEALERHRRWEAEQFERDQADLVVLQRRQRTRAWHRIVSDALDDQQLERAVEHLTTPVGGLGRRSVPLARAQLLAWAIDVHRREPDAPLDKALLADLEAEPTPLTTMGGPPPPAPYAPDAPDLSDRLEQVLQRRPDLDRPCDLTQTVELPRREVRFGLDLER